MNDTTRRHRPGTIPAIVTIAAAIALSGCAGTVFDTKRKTPPDEFAVVRQAPLIMPPSYGLVPPQPGMDRPQELQTTEQAKALLFEQRTQTAGLSASETSLLRAAGASEVDPSIRSTVNRESAALSDADDTLANRVMFWNQKPETAAIVDPGKEAERIAAARAAGQPVAAGETPTIRRTGQRSLFGNIF